MHVTTSCSFFFFKRDIFNPALTEFLRFYIFYRYKPLISQRNCYKMNIMIYLALSDFGELIFVVALCHLSS